MAHWGAVAPKTHKGSIKSVQTRLIHITKVEALQNSLTEE